MTPAVAALVIGGILLVAGFQGRNVVDVALGREGKMQGGSPSEAQASFGSSITSSVADAASGVADAAGAHGKGLARVIAECDRIDQLGKSYSYGGGHAGYNADGPWDCSGAVSYVLHEAGLLAGPPRISGLFTMWGSPGKGQHLTVWANAAHVFLEIDGRMWGTSRSNPGGGPGWHPVRDTTGFTPRHPANL